MTIMNLPDTSNLPAVELDKLIAPDAVDKIASFNDGFNVGFTWPDAWEAHGKPGGPWVFSWRSCGPGCKAGCDRQTTPRFTCRESHDYARLSQEKNRLWRLGWELGHAKKHAQGRRNSPRS